ncbi:MAG TPA: flagellar export chaperone FliS [Chloroflexota bacterium]|nr:flagellar export chaperone FliS [Chloroflexota bacterium]
MPVNNPYARYQQTAVKTADRGDLLILTYEALLRWLARAEDAIDSGRVVEAHEALIAAQQLVINLDSSLDFERGGQIATNLSALYDFVKRQLIEANITKDRAAVTSIRDLLSPLLDAWRAAVPMARKTGELASV